MVQAMKDNMNKGRQMARGCLSGPTGPSTKVNSSTITFKASAATNGLTEENTQENGRTTKCTDKACSHGRMEEDTMASI